MADTRNSQGSVWHRWDPHIHAPGTVLNDQFGGENPWEQFLAKIEQADPPIRALGITDYCGLDLYERVLEKKRQGRLSRVDLIFPNVEMRYAVGTSRDLPINVHLLISPEDPDHVDQARRFLRTLTFHAHGELFWDALTTGPSRTMRPRLPPARTSSSSTPISFVKHGGTAPGRSKTS
jgi:hypothetical protein